MKMPLEGLKVLDLSRLLPGPFCSMILADMGAEVLKIENPRQADPFRTQAPLVNGEGSVFLMLNRNKRSMTLNLQTEQGRAIFKELVKESDVLLEQFRPGVMERLGLGYESVQAINPQIIYCSISGFGQYGPYRDKASHDINHISISGVLDALRPKEGPPVLPGVPIAGAMGGALWAANSILTALLGRERNGQGQYLDVSITDGLLTLHCFLGGAYLASGHMPKAGDSEITGAFAYYHIYETRDGRYLSLGAYEAKFWAAFCTLIGRPEYIDEQFAPRARQAEIIADLQATMKTKTLAQWMAELGGLDICLTPVQNMAETFSDPHFRDRQMVVDVDHRGQPGLPTIAYPVKFSATPAQVKWAPPHQGQHSREVLCGLGYSEEQIEGLERTGVI